MRYATALDIGERKRRQGGINEDSVAINLIEEGHRDVTRGAGVFVLADGAGGAEAGDVASYITTVEAARRLAEQLWEARRLGTHFEKRGREVVTSGREGLNRDAVVDPLAGVDPEEIHEMIADAIQATHRRLLEVVNDLNLENAYSTVLAGIKAGDELHYGWVGDSRAYVINTDPERDENQRMSCLTKDHSVVEQLVTEGKIDEVEAYVHRRGNRITRALGGAYSENPAASSVDVETNTIPLFRDDVVLFTSDGLIDAYTGAPELHEQYQQADDTDQVERTILEKMVTDDEIRDTILEADTLDAAADQLIDLTNDRGGKDNVSLILFQDDSCPPSPKGGLPIRVYDPDPEEVVGWETVLESTQGGRQRTDAVGRAPPDKDADGPD